MDELHVLPSASVIDGGGFTDRSDEHRPKPSDPDARRPDIRSLGGQTKLGKTAASLHPLVAPLLAGVACRMLKRLHAHSVSSRFPHGMAGKMNREPKPGGSSSSAWDVR